MKLVASMPAVRASGSDVIAIEKSGSGALL